MKQKDQYGQAPGGRAGKGGAGRAAAGKRRGKEAKRKPPKGGAGARLALGLVTACNLGLTLALHVLRRQEALHAVETDEGVKLLLVRQGGTKPADGEKPGNSP